MSINNTQDQMLAIEQTPEGPGSGAAIKVFDQNKGKPRVNRYDQQLNQGEEKSFTTTNTYSDGITQDVNCYHKMDMRELEKTNEISVGPVQIGDVTCQNGSVESSLLNTIQEKQMIKKNRQDMMILDSITSESFREDEEFVSSQSKIADVSAKSSVIQVQPNLSL